VRYADYNLAGKTDYLSAKQKAGKEQRQLSQKKEASKTITVIIFIVSYLIFV